MAYQQEKLVTVVIDAYGNPTIEAQGFTGTDCLKATAPLEQAFSGAGVNRTYKPEFNQSNSTQLKNELRY